MDVTVGSFRVKSTHFLQKFDFTISDFDEIWHRGHIYMDLEKYQFFLNISTRLENTAI